MTKDKPALRARMKALREELSARDPDAGETVADRFPMKLFERYGPVVAGYWPIGSEIDPRPLMTKLAGAGAQLALPCVQQDGRMIYRAFAFGDPLEPRPFGLLEPAPHVGQLSPTLILTPLLAFDALGNRLGYGKGHYDRTIATLRETGRAFLCGLAYQDQEIDGVPADPHDIPLDWVVTPSGSIPLFMTRTFRNASSNSD